MDSTTKSLQSVGDAFQCYRTSMIRLQSTSSFSNCTKTIVWGGLEIFNNSDFPGDNDNLRVGGNRNLGV